jgi:hypothetical protein
LAANKKYQPNKDKKFVLVEQVKDVIFLISKMADRSWKHQLDQPRHLLVLVPAFSMSLQHPGYPSSFNFALDPKINSDAAKAVMPKADDDKTLRDIAKSFKQLSRDIKGAMAMHDPMVHL